MFGDVCLREIQTGENPLTLLLKETRALFLMWFLFMTLNRYFLYGWALWNQFFNKTLLPISYREWARSSVSVCHTEPPMGLSGNRLLRERQMVARRAIAEVRLWPYNLESVLPTITENHKPLSRILCNFHLALSFSLLIPILHNYAKNPETLSYC